MYYKDNLDKLKPEQIKKYLESNGWEYSEEWRGFMVYSKLIRDDPAGQLESYATQFPKENHWTDYNYRINEFLIYMEKIESRCKCEIFNDITKIEEVK